MRRKSAALVPLVGLLVLGACTGRDSTAPRGIAPDVANSATSPGPSSTCDFTAVKAAARDYFTSNQDPVYALIGDMSKAYGAGDYTTANTKGWAIGELVANERLTSATTNGSFGSVFVIDVLRCISDLSVNPAVRITVPDDFITHAAAVLNSGIWEIRGPSATSAAPALGKVVSNLVTPNARGFGTPGWGVESSTGTWFSTQHAVYAYPTSTTTLLGPTSINTNDALGGSYDGFELGTVPEDVVDHSNLRVGVCLQANGALSDGSVNRLVHNNNEILVNSSPSALCTTYSTGVASAVRATTTWYANLMQRATALFRPSILYAQDDFIGGLPSGWSPFSYGAVNAGAITLSFVAAPPPNTDTLTANTAIVKATVTNGTDTAGVPGVIVTISISGNSGQAGGATFQNGTTSVTGTTDKNGLASITYIMGKAGGYTLTTTGTFDGHAVGNTLVSTVNVKNQLK